MTFKKDHQPSYHDLSKILSSPVLLEHFKLDSESNINRFWSFFEMYNGKRVKENYQKKSYDYLIKENRFSYGAICLKLNEEEIISFCGLSEYKNWIIITRYVSFHSFKSIPFASAIMIPYLLSKCKEENKNGIIYTFNDYLKIVYDFYHYHNETINKNIPINEKKLHRYSVLRTNSDFINHELFDKAISTDSKYKTLDYPVNYKNTKQWVVYISLNNEQPIFEPYHEK